MMSAHSTTTSEFRRIMIILHYHNNSDYFKHTAKILSNDRETVSTWYYRGLIINNEWNCMVEIWFSILARKVLKRGNFVSKEDLKIKLEQFISYFNRTMAKPYKWTYKGKQLTI